MDLTFLKESDESLFLWLNSFHHSFLDNVMLLITHRFTWIPLYIFLIYIIIQTFKKLSFLVLPFIILLITLSDRISSGLIKPYFQRLRPCHNHELDSFIHLVGNCGGQYGFVSSHAANTFAIGMFLYLLFNKNKYFLWLFPWAFVVSYSRIYVGVHYPADVALGAILGLILGVLIYKLYQFLHSHSPRAFYQDR